MVEFVKSKILAWSILFLVLFSCSPKDQENKGAKKVKSITFSQGPPEYFNLKLSRDSVSIFSGIKLDNDFTADGSMLSYHACKLPDSVFYKIVELIVISSRGNSDTDIIDTSAVRSIHSTSYFVLIEYEDQSKSSVYWNSERKSHYDELVSLLVNSYESCKLERVQETIQFETTHKVFIPVPKVLDQEEVVPYD